MSRRNQAGSVVALPFCLLRRLLAHPQTAGLDLDDPAMSELRKQIIASNRLPRAIYDELYSMLARELPAGEGAILD